ncbi:sugar ABC transporter substrate-binding protein [Halalkalibacter kiskunsagensis]|uniref:Sugar ABC transporter substrate-binding protein n=1 Tax=Halalkalibacter kiskunsagensis TaxID=1548599 RepID=A0ABV6KD15_9BACI
MFTFKKRLIFQFLFTVALITLVINIVNSHVNDRKPRVVVVLKALEAESEYWTIVSEGAKKAFKDFKIQGQVIGTHNLQVTEQIEILKDVLQSKPDALIVAAIQPTPIIPILKEYKNHNIPVLLVDTELEWDGQTMYIGTDNYDLGVRSGQLLGSMLQPGNQVAFIHSTNVNPDMVKRLKGSRNALEAIGVNIVTERSADNVAGEVEIAIDEILQKYPNIKGIFAATDTIAINTMGELEKNGYKIPIIGTDGTLKMLKEVSEGRISATIAQNPFEMGYLSVLHALNTIKGKLSEDRLDTGVDIIIKENSVDRMNFLATKLK